VKSKFYAVKKEEDALEKCMDIIDKELGKVSSQANNGFVFPNQPIVSCSELTSFVAQAKDCIVQCQTEKLP
jgi:hypothetical protein